MVFFSSVPGLNCFNPASLREVSPLRVQPLLLAHLSLATLICLEQECDIAATPCSPFGPGRALLPFPSQGRFQLQYPPSHGSLTSHYCVANQPAQDCALKDFSADFSRLNCYATISFFRSLRSPYGFQCFPSTEIIARCLVASSFRRSLALASMPPVFQHECWCIRRAQLSYTFTRVSATPKCGFVLLRAHLLIFANLGAPHLSQLNWV